MSWVRFAPHRPPEAILSRFLMGGSGCLRLPNRDKAETLGHERYKKGYELRFSCGTEEDVRLVIQALGEAGCHSGRSYVKRNRIILPVYGRRQVEILLTLLFPPDHPARTASAGEGAARENQNTEKRRKTQREYYWQNRDQLLAAKREQYARKKAEARTKTAKEVESDRFAWRSKQLQHYHNSEEYRQNTLARQKARYANDPEFREKAKAYARERYRRLKEAREGGASA